MNDVLLREIIKCKLDIAEAIVDRLPEEVSKEIKRAGQIVLEVVNENVKANSEGSNKKPRTANKLEEIIID